MIDTKPTTNGHGPATLQAPTAGKAIPHEVTVGQAKQPVGYVMSPGQDPVRSRR